jgi:hypothetical protein
MRKFASMVLESSQQDFPLASSSSFFVIGG